MYKTLQGKKAVYSAHHISAPDAACSLGWSCWVSYSRGCSNGTHHYNHNLASADTSRGAGDCCPIIPLCTLQIPERWAGPASCQWWQPVKCNEMQGCVTCY